MDPASTITAFGAIAAWLALVQANRLAKGQKRRKEEQAAIDAICRAAEETRMYVAVTEPLAGHGDQPRDLGREAKLSNLWMRAGNLLGDIDMQLARRCEFKSGYWHDPDGWSDGEVEKVNIQLQDIYEKACELRRT